MGMDRRLVWLEILRTKPRNGSAGSAHGRFLTLKVSRIQPAFFAAALGLAFLAWRAPPTGIGLFQH